MIHRHCHTTCTSRRQCLFVFWHICRYCFVGIGVLFFGVFYWATWWAILPRLFGYNLSPRKIVLSDGTVVTKVSGYLPSYLHVLIKMDLVWQSVFREVVSCKFPSKFCINVTRIVTHTHLFGLPIHPNIAVDGESRILRLSHCFLSGKTTSTSTYLISSSCSRSPFRGYSRLKPVGFKCWFLLFLWLCSFLSWRCFDCFEAFCVMFCLVAWVNTTSQLHLWLLTSSH